MHRLRRVILAILGFWSAVGVADPAWAQRAEKDRTITLGEQGRLSGAEARDWRAVEGAISAFNSQGFDGLETHRSALEAALARAPTPYPAVERRRDRMIVRANDMGDVMVLSLLGSVGDEGRGQTRVVSQPNVYPMAALLLGSAAIQRRDYDDAISVLDRGLALQPADRFLINERIAALHGLGKWAEALAAADAALASGDLLISTNGAALHRKRGFSLIELGRLDEAQSAYEESLKEEPDNAIAKAQLDYIGQLRVGGASRTPSIVAPHARTSTRQPLVNPEATR